MAKPRMIHDHACYECGVVHRCPYGEHCRVPQPENVQLCKMCSELQMILLNFPRPGMDRA